MSGLMGGWMGGWMGEWMGGWVDEWVGGWVIVGSEGFSALNSCWAIN